MSSNETLEVIKKRRSIRAFTTEQVKDEDLQAVLEAGMYAPSAANQQAWHFTVIQNKEVLDRLNHDAKEAGKQSDNEYIRKIMNNEKFNIFYDAPTLIIVSGNAQAMVIESDCAAANQNMLLGAEALGLGSCWINLVLLAFGLPDGQKYLEELGIPAGYKPFCSTVLGYKKIEPLNAPERKSNIINFIK